MSAVQQNQPVGIIRLQDEPEELILIKFVGWLIVMILFVAVLFMFSEKFNAEGFILKQERSDYGADARYLPGGWL